MSVLSVSELQAQVETDLGDTPIQSIIDAVESDIEARIGPTTGYTHEYDRVQYQHVLRLTVKASSITTVVEYREAQSEPDKTTLSADDYELSDDGWWLRRLSDGTNSYETWGWHVVVTFEPASDTARRKQAAIKLARLEIVHSGFASQGVGDSREQSTDYQRERANILRSLDRTGGIT
jgi:hypothetical protein